MGYNILFFPWRDWNSIKREGFRTREANILKTLMDRPEVDKILCVNRSGIPKIGEYIFNLKDKNRYFYGNKKEYYYTEEVISSSFFSKLKRMDNKLYVLEMNFHLPNPKGNKLERFPFFQKILHKQIKEALVKINIHNYWVWNVDLTRIYTASTFKKDLLVFDAIDNLLEHDQKSEETSFLNQCYDMVNKRADIIFTVSSELKETLFLERKNSTYHIPNGIDLSMYSQKCENKPFDLPDNNSPIIGYVGLLQERLDLTILEKIINDFPNCNFVFVGPILSPKYFKGLKRFTNVYFLGPKRHEEIKSYLQFFDISIIPHKVNKFTKSMNPLKLYEYLASGNQVITTPVPPSEEFKDVIYIAKNPAEFSRTIKNCLEKPLSNTSKKNIHRVIKMHDWQDRVEKMMLILEQFNKIR
ncbi:glycosyltransferase [Bacillus sp. FJAT-27445]|uniref:glycosyltransferase n=1 Tax=Bacillus sp. FJAT-27445 TaxID=1679166 RepID=UPI0007441FD7|nr:glycosyltransferase [Bacillus sp. FJAT-27445]